MEVPLYSRNNLFGGLLDRCTISYFDKTIKYSDMQGFADYNNILNSKSSKPVQICLCDSVGIIDCNLKPTPILIKKGIKFNLKIIAAVDHVNNSVNTTATWLIIKIALWRSREYQLSEFLLSLFPAPAHLHLNNIKWQNKKQKTNATAFVITNFKICNRRLL